MPDERRRASRRQSVPAHGRHMDGGSTHLDVALVLEDGTQLLITLSKRAVNWGAKTATSLGRYQNKGCHKNASMTIVIRLG